MACNAKKSRRAYINSDGLLEVGYCRRAAPRHGRGVERSGGVLGVVESAEPCVSASFPLGLSDLRPVPAARLPGHAAELGPGVRLRLLRSLPPAGSQTSMVDFRFLTHAGARSGSSPA
jgi:hypothetical protein